MPEQAIRDRLNALIDEIIDAEHDCNNATQGRYRVERAEADATRKRVMDILMQIYVDGV